jgi:hypothetical protein
MKLDEIVSIEKLDKRKTVDIEVSGNHLFYANDILTHNSNSDVDLTNTSESMGITHTADAIFGLITNEELEALGQIMIKQLKNRWGDLGYYRRFVIGIDRSRMKLFNLEDGAQVNVSNETPNAASQNTSDESVFDKSMFGESLKNGKKVKLFDTGDLM